MLPNWLYGKSKSKLATILGGGTPADYNQVKAQLNQNTEDILLLSDALDGKASKSQISNPNIFHNPWFTVNQRGITSATQNADYIADRWMVYFGDNNSTITRDSNGNIVMDNTLGTTNITIYQKRTQTYLKSLVGQKLTASMMLSDGTIYSGTITYTGTGNPVYFENDYVKAHAPVLTASQIITYSVKPGASVTIKAVKLEVGEISTLAMDPRPEYATELAKCQRYFQRVSNVESTIQAFGFATPTSATYLKAYIPISQMRTKPTIAISNAADIVYSDSDAASGTAITSISLGAIIGLNSVLSIQVLSTVANTLYKLYLASGGYIDFSAEL